MDDLPTIPGLDREQTAALRAWVLALIRAEVRAEFHRIRSAKTARAARARKAQGLGWGRPPSVDQAKLDEAARLRREGRPWRTVSESVGVPLTTLRRWLDPRKG